MSPGALPASRPPSLHFTMIGRRVHLRHAGAAEPVAAAYLCGVRRGGVTQVVEGALGADLAFPDGGWAAVIDVTLPRPVPARAVGGSAAAAVPVKCPGRPAVRTLLDAARALPSPVVFVPFTLVSGVIASDALRVCCALYTRLLGAVSACASPSSPRRRDVRVRAGAVEP